MNLVKNNLKLSVVTPSYNQGQFLEETIDSVLSQNYPNLEYIIIDGGSSDKSIEIIKKYEKHLKFWVSEKDRGHSDALNKGFSHATGDVFSWINSDDKYFPWAFSTVAEVFSSSQDIMWLTGLRTGLDSESRIIIADKLRKNLNDFLVVKNHWIQQESTFWRKELWEKAGGKITTDYKLMVDSELWARFFTHAELWHIDIALGAYRFHGTNRAVLHYQEVLREMDKIVSDLRKEVGVTKTSQAFIQSCLKKMNLVANRLLGLKILSTDVYPVMRREEGKWIQTYEKI